MAISVLIARAAIFTALIPWLSPSPGLAQHTLAVRPRSQDVQPSPEIDKRVADSVWRAREILNSLDAGNLLASPYLVSAIYYHDDFLLDFPADRASADPERRIIGQITALLTPQLKSRFVGLLDEIWTRSSPTGSLRYVNPVDFAAVAGGRGSHKFAIDLFAREGTAVHSVSRGVVILAEGNWRPDDLFSSTSRKGGNSVIVFDPDQDRFYRYCHLNSVLVTTGQTVSPGAPIGSVGHTGLNASQRGHGGHLHFEANEYLNGHVRAMDYRRLRALLLQARAH